MEPGCSSSKAIRKLGAMNESAANRAGVRGLGGKGHGARARLRLLLDEISGC
jgi:hypothetical protein